MGDLSTYLEQTYYLDYTASAIQKLVAEVKGSGMSDENKAITIYDKIRDGWLYFPYYFSFTKENFKASVIAQKDEGHCLEKSILLIACLRALSIPARLHLAKVKNHIAVERLVEKFGTNELTPHAMVDVFLNDTWLKISPAFNKELCVLCNVDVLGFDGKNDAVFQEYDKEGGSFMEYLEDYGHFEDVPIEFIFDLIKSHYPHIIEQADGATEIYL
ncbi:transglutaminase family protein [Aquimarina sp. 2-A2]|uniref:transglutaminase-like domain-containing protein n=1 Tax=Aquimarina sp. 2-A2 TaxID=3382644 RepID=UPI00387F3302